MKEESEKAEGKRQKVKDRRSLILFFAFCLLPFAFFLWTMNADVQPADSGEFQLAALTLGIPHPPGYPLYTLLGWLFAQVPLGSPFARVTLVSVVAASLALAVVARTIDRAALQRAADSRWPILLAMGVAVLALGTSTTFWAQATTTNIRSLTALFSALLLFTFMRGWQAITRARLVQFAIVLGLGVGHHISLVFIGALFGLVLLVKAVRARLPWRDFAAAAIALLATQLVWVYLPLRNAAPSLLAHGDLATLNGFLDHVLARGFEGDLFYFIRAEPNLFWDRLALTPTLLQFQFGLPVLVLMGLAALIVVWRQRGLGLILLAAFALHLFITLTYRAPQTVEYALPCWVIAAVVLGLGLAEAGVLVMTYVRDPSRRLTADRISILLSLVALIFVGRDLRQRLPSFIALAQDRSTRVAAEAALRNVQAEAIIWSQWHQATPMWALQAVDHLQPTVQVQYSYPEGAEPYEVTFAKRAAASRVISPTYITSFFDAELATQQVQARPVFDAPMWHVEQISTTLATTPIAAWDARLQLLPASIPSQTVALGQLFYIDAAWNISGTAQPGDALTFRMLRPDGRAATNADVLIMGAGTRRLALAAPYDLPPGPYDLLVGAYNGDTIYNADSGEPYVSLGKINIVPTAVQFPAPTAASQVIPFADQMALAGYSVNRNGSRLTIDLDWLALQPLTADYKISVRVTGDNGQHWAHDGVPALGAIPTLKWIAGSRVADRHVFDLGDYAGPLTFEVVVYDQVTRIPLIPLDARFPDGVRIAISR